MLTGCLWYMLLVLIFNQCETSLFYISKANRKKIQEGFKCYSKMKQIEPFVIDFSK